MKNLFTYILLLASVVLFSQSQTKRVLFIGNSYTYVNNLPQMIADMAATTNDTLIFDSSTPGGHSLKAHLTNSNTINKIKAGNWDYVVLQDQSQRPSFPYSFVQAEVLPYARGLDSLINHHNPCAETVFYMTWGRKNGDASNCTFFSPLCTYQGMDSLLNLRYQMMADSNEALVSPVGAVWNYIRNNHPSIELYSPDESHPSIAGTYAAACAFYSTFFRKNPALVSFTSTLPSVEANIIRLAAKAVVFDSLSNWNIGKYDPMADFVYMTMPDTACLVGFNNLSINADTYLWDFGDGRSSSLKNPTNIYATGSTYVVTLVASKCSQADTFKTVLSSPCIQSLPERDFSSLNWSVYPNPVKHNLSIAEIEPVSIQFTITNLTGQKVQGGSLEMNSNSINISALTEGAYFIHLIDGKQTLGSRIFIKAD
jgi:hypothetical protein